MSSEQFQPGARRPGAQPNTALVVIGFITAVLIPIVGLIIGILVMTRPGGQRIGGWIVGTAVAVFLISFILIASG